jgi:putative membrane protein
MRPLLVASGLTVLTAAWLSPLAETGAPFSSHMARHMGVVAVAAPLIAVGLAGGRFDPVPRLPALLAPMPACVVEFVIVWVWHAPALHDAARHTLLGLLLEQASFLFSGLVVWIAAFGGSASERQERGGAGVLSMLLTSMHMTLLGALLALAPRALYAHAHHGSVENSLTPLADQHLGGVIMLLIGGVSYAFGGLWLTASLLKAMRGRGA